MDDRDPDTLQTETCAIPPVLFEHHGPVAVITLNRPGQANTFNTAMRAALAEAKQRAAADDSVRAVVVTGAGRHFSAGADLREPAAQRAEGRQRHPGASEFGGIPKPVLAAVNGPALGGGCELALSCDLRFLSAEARMGLTEIRFGALPLGGGTVRLPRVAGLAAARRMVLTGEPVDAAECLRTGLADFVLPADRLLAQTIDFAARLARHEPALLSAAKALLDAALEGSLAEALERESVLARELEAA